MARATKAEALETRERILDAAEDVFFRNGVTRTSLMDIANEAGVTRGAIYWHFKNKGDVFHAMCERCRLPMEEMLDVALEKNVEDPLEELGKSISETLKGIASNDQWRRILDIIFNRCERTDPDDPVVIRDRECRLEFREKIYKILQNAKAKGQLAPTFNVQRGGRMFRASISGILEDWLFDKNGFDLKKEADTLVKVCITTLKTCPYLCD